MGCILTATVLETLSGLLALILFVMLFPGAAGRFHQSLLSLLLWLPLASALLGIPLGNYFAEGQQQLARCGRWLFPIAALPPGVFSIFVFREGRDEIWPIIASDWLVAYFFLSAPIVAAGLLFCALILLFAPWSKDGDVEEEGLSDPTIPHKTQPLPEKYP